MEKENIYLPSQWKIRKENAKEKKLLKYLLIFGIIYFMVLIIVASKLNIILS